MKYLSTLVATFLSLLASAQDKTDYVHYNRFIEISGTEYVVATMQNLGKMGSGGSQPMFINTRTGEKLQTEFPKGSYTGQIEQIRIDSLQLNVVVVTARTVDLDEKKGIEWTDPMQVIVFSPAQHKLTRVTEDRYFAQAWSVNHQTGCLVIAGHYDSNENGKYDKTDKSEILLYDLKKGKMVAKL